MWDDLQTSYDTGDDIYVETGADYVTIRWQGGYCCSADPDINISCTLYADGKIRLSYGAGNSQSDNLIGISSGNGTDYLVSSQSGTSRENASDIVFTPGNPTWTPFWQMPLGDYTWWVQPQNDCTTTWPWSDAGMFSIISAP
jgi:hypothetical protein